MCSIPTKQKIITYCANGDPIGNSRHDNDVGSDKWLPVKGEARIPDQSDRVKNVFENDALAAIFPSEFVEDTVKAYLTKYHSMKDKYQTLKNSRYKNGTISFI